MHSKDIIPFIICAVFAIIEFLGILYAIKETVAESWEGFNIAVLSLIAICCFFSSITLTIAGLGPFLSITIPAAIILIAIGKYEPKQKVPH